MVKKEKSTNTNYKLKAASLGLKTQKSSHNKLI